MCLTVGNAQRVGARRVQFLYRIERACDEALSQDCSTKIVIVVLQLEGTRFGKSAHTRQ
jgi:hypothetical protein